MKPKTALARIKLLVGKGFYGFPQHCRDGMEEHGIGPLDVLGIVDAAGYVEEQDDGRWRIEGVLDSEDPVRVVIDVDLSVEVTFVTVHLILPDKS